jgi:hypothetical protein
VFNLDRRHREVFFTMSPAFMHFAPTAPAKFSLPANAKRNLDVGFGIVDGAWQGDANTVPTEFAFASMLRTRRLRHGNGVLIQSRAAPTAARNKLR